MSDFDLDFGKPNKEKIVAPTNSMSSNNNFKADTTPNASPEFVEVHPNSITVERTDNSPIIVLWGPTSSGKSLAMIRLARYLRSKNYSVKPVKNFRPGDALYKTVCDKFDSFLSSNEAPTGTGVVNFLLLQVEKDGNKICQILEAPGEHYFEAEHPDALLPTYLSTIVNLTSCPKLYVFFLEIGWKDSLTREQYSAKIANFFSRVKGTDSIILLCNKSDEQNDYIYNGHPEREKYFNDIKNLYPKIFLKLGRKGLFKFLLPESKKYDFVVFSSGDFPVSSNGQMFVQGDDLYPELLWSKILKNIKGSWF